MSKLIPYKGRRAYGTDDTSNTSPQVDTEKSAWDYYNDKARIEDIELVKDWYETLSNLLIFAALFSAILTAFVIESMKRLQEDPQETTRDILLFMTMQAVNASLPNATVLPYQTEPFHLDGYVIAMNCMFFASLSLSLLAALASIIILQWVGKYDAGILSYPTAKERALHRQFRFDGVRTWRMEDMIGALPYMLYMSLVFFFIGAIIWLSHMNTIVMVVVTTLFLLGVVAYIITTILAVIVPSTPFRTPLSDYIITLLFNTPRSRENEAVNSKKSFELRTLLKYLESIEVVSHSYRVLSTIVRMIMEQPFDYLCGPDGVVSETRWKNIFQIILSAYQETPEDRQMENDTIMSQSLADYTVSLFLQESTEYRVMVKKLLEYFSISSEHHPILKGNNLDFSNSETYGLDLISPGFLYGVIRSLQNLTEGDFRELLNWLATTIQISPEEFYTARRLPNTSLGTLLTTAASIICKMHPRERLMTDRVFSVTEFAEIVTPGIENNPFLTDDILPFFHSLFIYLCSRLAQSSEHSVAMYILEEISALLIPRLQGIESYVAIYALLGALSKCSTSVKTSARAIINKALDVNSGRGPINTSLRRLLSVDYFIKYDNWIPASEDARGLLASFIYDPSLFEVTTFDDRELELSLQINDPALKLMAASISTNFLDVPTTEIQIPVIDPLFGLAASYWIAHTLWGSDSMTLSSGKLDFLERLLGMLGITLKREYDSGLIGQVIHGRFNAHYKSLGFIKSFQKFDAFISSCQPHSFLRLLKSLEFEYLEKSGVKSHLLEGIRDGSMTRRILSLLEEVWDPILVDPNLFEWCWIGIQRSDDPVLLESYCFFAISTLNVCTPNRLNTRIRSIAPLLGRLHSLAVPEAFLRVKTCLSRCIAREEALRSQCHFLELGHDLSWHPYFTHPENEFLSSWIVDLGSPRWMAFTSKRDWSFWIKEMKEFLNKFPKV